MWGAIIGGVTGALTSGINIATGAVKVVGSAQKTGTFFHRMASNIQAGKLVEVTSKSQTNLQMEIKLIKLLSSNPNTTYKVIGWAARIAKWIF